MCTSLLVSLAVLVSSGLVLGKESIVDSPMYKLPELPIIPEIILFPDGARELWLRALERKEVEMQVKAAGAIANARRRGMKGLETTIGPLQTVLEREDLSPAVRTEVVKTLLTLDAKAVAPTLLGISRTGSSELRDLIDPVLARWDHKPARVVWLARLQEPTTRPRSLVLSIRALATVREAKAVDRLRELVLTNRTPATVRLEAAQALNQLRSEGLEKEAERLAADDSPLRLVERLAAASLLQKHKSAEAIALLQRLLKDREPAVGALAADRLIAIDPKLTLGGLDHLLGSPDAKLRGHGVEILFRLPDEKHIGLLGDRLDDLHLDVRNQARRALFQLGSKKDFHTLVIAQGTRLLDKSSWRGLEQAAILLTYLDHKPAATRLVELLTHGRPEVFITAAWGLRKLAVKETLPAVTRYLDEELRRLLKTPRDDERKNIPPSIFDHQLSQLHQFVGTAKYQAADKVLRRYIPRMDRLMISEARAAAIWALGMVHEGKKDTALAGLIEARLKDINSMPPEDVRVRTMSAISLGRMQAKQTLATLRGFYVHMYPVDVACMWAVTQITGEPMPKLQPVEKTLRDWFLVPNK
jgi:HEAT repeat protein